MAGNASSPEESVTLAATRALSIAIRLREKKDYVSFVGQKDTSELIMKLLPALQEPLVELYASGDIPLVRRNGHVVMGGIEVCYQ